MDDFTYVKSCGAVLFTIKDKEYYYLLIENRGGNIGFPKGHSENGENEYQTAKREISEETGVDALFIQPFRESNRYIIGNGICKEVIYFLAEFKETDIEIPLNEIKAYFILKYEDAYNIITFEKDKEILKKAHHTIVSIPVL